MSKARGAGRYAPSPSGDLHLGNLRTALLAWADARSSERSFLLRVDDMDRAAPGAADRQLADLAALGIEWDGPVRRQTEHSAEYRSAIEHLSGRGLVFECYCSRKDIQQAAEAPHGPPGAYPGTCRRLDEPTRERRRTDLASRGRRPALRLAADGARWAALDAQAGEITGQVDDFVLMRGDGVPAYNLASVADDGATGVDRVVRGDDLLTSVPRQAFLAHLLGLPQPEYLHVPLVLAPSGARLAKRDGAVTLGQLGDLGWSVSAVFAAVGQSLGTEGLRSASDFLGAYPTMDLGRGPWVFAPPAIL